MPYHYWQGRNIKLRAMDEQDIDFFEALDDEVDRNVDAVHFPRTKQHVVSWFESQRQRMLGDAFRWMADNREGETIGTIDTFSCNRRNGTFKYGITVADSFRRRGYAKEMIMIVLNYYFHELGYQKVTPHVYSFNTASLKLHEGMGFVKEGQLRNMLFTNGQYYDEIYFGMTKDEFQSIHGNGLISL